MIHERTFDLRQRFPRPIADGLRQKPHFCGIWPDQPGGVQLITDNEVRNRGVYPYRPCE